MTYVIFRRNIDDRYNFEAQHLGFFFFFFTNNHFRFNKLSPLKSELRNRHRFFNHRWGFCSSIMSLMSRFIRTEAFQKLLTPVRQGQVLKREDNVKDDHCFLIHMIVLDQFHPKKQLKFKLK